MAPRVRVRYAPSPTGEPHIGNIRTAIFDWLFARSAGGAFIIRIEDTDQARTVAGAAESLLDALRWLGLDWDEGPDVGGDYGPYVQSQRLSSYERVAEQLLDAGKAYRCYCSPERLAELRREQGRAKQHVGYDRRCRNLSDTDRAAQESSGITPVVRFAMPRTGTTTVSDLVRGEVSFENQLVDDFVMLKSDGFPTYHLANVADDHAMEISHVLRAEEWLPSTPRHLHIYRALGWEPPAFAHLPTVLAPDRSKLSKRHGATSAVEYREMGYLPQAMVNFLALLGWSLDDKTELFSAQELITSFTIERVSRAGAVFNAEKLGWMNGHYIRQLDAGDLADALLEYWSLYPPAEFDGLPERPYLVRIAPLIQERLKTLGDVAPLTQFFFKPDAEYEVADLAQKGMDSEAARGALQAALAALEGVGRFDAGSIEAVLRSLAESLGLKTGQLLGTLRVATTGQRVSPPLFETMELLGRERTLEAVRAASEALSLDEISAG